ncbi:MAG: hypothetical protein ABSH16_09045 [Sedimentisphaerales bacterium]
MTERRKINAFFGFLAGIISAVFGSRTAKPTAKDLKDVDFSTSTQRLGVRLTDRIRDVFRFKWIKKP